MWAATPRPSGDSAVRWITRRYSVPPFKGVVAVKAREEIIAEIGVEAFVIEIWIAIAAALHSLQRPWRNLRSRAVVVDPWIAA